MIHKTNLLSHLSTEALTTITMEEAPLVHSHEIALHSQKGVWVGGKIWAGILEAVNTQIQTSVTARDQLQEGQLGRQGVHRESAENATNLSRDNLSALWEALSI